jgi:hypothetical protein
METKLTVRVPKDALANAKRYAEDHNTTLTRLISTFLERFPFASSEILERAPTVRRLTGLLSQDISLGDYKIHLETKYGGG